MENTVKIAVCDDEKYIRVYLVSLIKMQGIKCCITEYASADEYLSDGREHHLLFLDIEMDGQGAGINGIGLAKHIREMDSSSQPIIVFVTGYEKYVYDAFDVGAFQYLIKPVDERKFAEVFGRAVERITREMERRKKKLVLKSGGEGRAIPVDDIYYIESQNHNIMFYLKDGKFKYYGKIGDFEKELKGQFYRIHRGYLINFFYVKGYDRTEVRMENGERLLLSRYKYDGFVQAYINYISEETNGYVSA